MSKKPKLLDTFCKAGGAAMGYYMAGFDITGVDIEPQPNYPFKFIQADAIEFINKNGYKYDIIHASPPCQEYSVSTFQFRKKGKQYKNLIEETRTALIKSGKPYIIENVPCAPIRPDIVLKGTDFNLRLLKKRHFELSFFMLQHAFINKPGTVRNGDFIQVVGNGQLKVTNGKPFKHAKENVLKTWSNEMGIDWMTNNKELAEAIPPAYTFYIGKQAMDLLFKTKLYERK